MEDGAFRLFFNGENKTMNTDALFSFFVQEGAKYESFTLFYRERGYQMELMADEKNIKTKKTEEKQEVVMDNPLLKNREYIIRPSQAPDLLKAIGIMTAEGKIKNDMIRKYNQIDRFIELIAPLFPADNDKELTVIDCCCGKSYLSFVINFYLREVCKKKCRIIGIDIKPNVIEESRRIAKELGYHNMEFFCEDVSCYQPDFQPAMVLSLHACDIATDLAIALGIRTRAESIVCVPCCHKEMKDAIGSADLAPILRHGIFKARFNDLMTDGMWALKMEEYGYEVDALEYISPLDSPKNLMLKARKKRDYNSEKGKEYAALAAYLGTEPSILKHYVY